MSDSIDRIIGDIDTGLAASELLLPAQARNVEDQVWAQLHDSFKEGWIDTIEEAQDRYLAWQIEWRGEGRHIGSRALGNF